MADDTVAALDEVDPYAELREHYAQGVELT
jgi:hypothetical protein